MEEKPPYPWLALQRIHGVNDFVTYYVIKIVYSNSLYNKGLQHFCNDNCYIN